MIEYLGLWILIALSFNMWALQSMIAAQATLLGKLIWALVLITLPGVGFFVWYLFGPRRAV